MQFTLVIPEVEDDKEKGVAIGVPSIVAENAQGPQLIPLVIDHDRYG